MSDKDSEKKTPDSSNMEDLFRTTISPPPGAPKEEAPPPPPAEQLDPHATGFMDLAALKKTQEPEPPAPPPPPMDPHATSMMQIPKEPTSPPPVSSAVPTSPSLSTEKVTPKAADDMMETMLEKKAIPPAPPPPPAQVQRTPPPAAPTASQQEGAPILSFIPRTLDFGQINNQNVTQVDLSVRNSGEGQLTGVVVPVVDWLEIVGSSQINCGPRVITKYALRTKRTAIAAVNNQPLVELRTNASNTPGGSLSVLGSYAAPIPQGLDVLPDKINFPAVKPDRLDGTVHATITVHNKSNEAMAVSLVSSAAWIQLSETALRLAPDESKQVGVTSRPLDIPDLQQSNTGQGSIRFLVDGKPELTVELPVSLRVKRASAVQLDRLILWGEYLGLALLSVLGLALFMRMVVLLVIFGHFDVIAVILGMLGAAASAGVFFAFTLVPPLFGIEEKLDQIEMDASGGTLLASIEESRATIGLWFFVLIGLLVVAGALGGLMAFNVPLLDDRDVKEAKEAGALALGVLGAAIVAGLGGYSEAHTPFSGTTARRFDFRHLIRPLALGIGLPAFAAGLALIGHNAWDIPLYFLLALIGMIGIGGSSLRTMPLRLHQWSGRAHVGLVAGAATVAAMSILTLLIDKYTIEYRFIDDETYRFAYSPQHLVFTAKVHSLILISLFGIPLVLTGVLGSWIALQAFGYNLMNDRTQRQNLTALVVGSLGVLLLPLLIIWVILVLLPLGETTEGWLIWGIPFLVLLLEVWLIRERPGVIEGVLARLRPLVGMIPASADFIKAPLTRFVSIQAAQMQSVVTWKLGFAFAVVGSIIMAPLLISFWFWPLALIGVAYLVNFMKPPQMQSAPPPPPSGVSG